MEPNYSTFFFFGILIVLGQINVHRIERFLKPHCNPWVPNLEKLVVKSCIRLIEVHPSVVVHKRLTLLDLEGCKNLRCLPSKFEMESLEILNLSNCSKINRIPKFMGNTEHLSKLHLDGTAIMKLPSSVEHLTNLAALHLRDCKNLVSS